MAVALAGVDLDQARSFDADAEGRGVLLDRAGRRLRLVLPGRDPVRLDLEETALRCRLRGDRVLLLESGGTLRTLDLEGRTLGLLEPRAGAADVAVLAGGSVLVCYAEAGVREHGVVLDRFGEAPLMHRDPAWNGARALAAESGGFWVLGVAGGAPRAVRLRPRGDALVLRESFALLRPPRAATIGPDGALYVLLEPGDALSRVDAGAVAGPLRLPAAALELARVGSTLWALAPERFLDLTSFVPPAPPDRPEPPLPSCRS